MSRLAPLPAERAAIRPRRAPRRSWRIIDLWDSCMSPMMVDPASVISSESTLTTVLASNSMVLPSKKVISAVESSPERMECAAMVVPWLRR